jgi:hypothetical protein
MNSLPLMGNQMGCERHLTMRKSRNTSSLPINDQARLHAVGDAADAPMRLHFAEPFWITQCRTICGIARKTRQLESA